MTPQQKLDALGMTRKGLGRALGCSDATVGAWCRDGAAPQVVDAWLDSCLSGKPTLALKAGRPKQKESANG